MIITINNIKMTKEEVKILDGFKIKILDDAPVIVENPYSKEKVELKPEAVAIYDIIMGCEITLNVFYDKRSEEMFYAAKDVFLRNWPKEYNLLID